MFQPLDLSASVGQQLKLSFDWTFDGEVPDFDENFVVALGDGSGNFYGADGNLGVLLNPADYDSGTFSIILDNAFINTAGWTLEFQMLAGFDTNGSHAIVDNVSLEAISTETTPIAQPQPVPLAFAPWLSSIVLFAVAYFNRRRLILSSNNLKA